MRQSGFMVQSSKCRLGYNGVAAAANRWPLCACVNNANWNWTYNCKLLQKRNIEMGILSDDKKAGGFLAKEDCPGVGKANGMDATIVDFEMRNLAKPGDTEMKPILITKEHSPMVLNPTNRDWLLDRFGDDSRCVGKVVVIWHDADVEYPRGKKVGGLRICSRIERDELLADTKTSDAPFDDDIPFGD